MLTLRSIVHPTDFSDASAEAFAHALRIALTAKCALTLVHVATGRDQAEWASFPHIRAALSGWGLASEHDTPAAVAAKLGVKIAKVELEPQPATAGILRFLDDNPADLIVLATQGREGVARWLRGSVAEKLARHAKVDVGAALRRANAKFEARFRAMEALAAADGGLAGKPLDAQDRYWALAKAAEKEAKR